MTTKTRHERGAPPLVDGEKPAAETLHRYLAELGLQAFEHARGTAYRLPVTPRRTRALRARQLAPERRRELEETLARLGAPPLAEDEELLAATIATRDLDRYGDVVETAGARVADYMRNPVVLWAHDASQPPVGTCVEISIGPDGIRTLTRFSTATRLAREVAALYREGTLHAFSIGFLPDPNRVERVTDARGRQGYRFLAWDLLEYSCVAVPANPNAVVSAVKRGLLTQDALREAILQALGEHEANAVRHKLRLDRNLPPEPPPPETDGDAYWKREAKRAFAERDRERAQRRLLESLLREIQHELVAEAAEPAAQGTPQEQLRKDARPEGRASETILLDGTSAEFLRREIALAVADGEAHLARLAENEIVRQAGRLPREKKRTRTEEHA